MSVKKQGENVFIYTDKTLIGFCIRYVTLIYFGYQGITGILGNGDYTLFGGVVQLIIAIFFLLFGKKIANHITVGPIVDLNTRELLLPAGLLNVLSTCGGEACNTKRNNINFESLKLDEITGISSHVDFEINKTNNSIGKKYVLNILGNFGSRRVTIYDRETYDSLENTLSIACNLE